jgi:P27 family predicted phage terminase small subunit
MPGNRNSGRRPQPTRLKVLRGNPGRRRLNRHEPQPPAVDDTFDTPPDVLHDDPVAAVEWARLAPLLRGMGVVTEADRSALLALCIEWARYCEAHAFVQAHGVVVLVDNHIVLNPCSRVAHRALSACRTLWGEFGLTPGSRSRLTVIPEAAQQLEDRWPGLR